MPARLSLLASQDLKEGVGSSGQGPSKAGLSGTLADLRRFDEA